MKKAIALYTLLLIALAAPLRRRRARWSMHALRTAAQGGQAAQYTPADLHTAKVALNEAETAFEDDPESKNTFALSYVALRTTQLVEAKANTKAAEASYNRTEQELLKLRDTEITVTKGELQRMKSEMAVRDQQLASERAARAAAEARESDAMKKLAEAAALTSKKSRAARYRAPGSVLFASGKYELTGAAQQKAHPGPGTIRAAGREPRQRRRGSHRLARQPEYNVELSQNRAQVVMNFLVQRGVPPNRSARCGIGPDRPITSNDSRTGRQENPSRRDHHQAMDKK